MIIISKINQEKVKKGQKNNENRAIQINSVQANSLYYVNNGVETANLDRGKAVINGSLFSEYMRSCSARSAFILLTHA